VNSFVIESWKSGNRPVDATGNYVHIVARGSGLLAWLLSLLKVESTTRVSIGIERLEFVRRTWNGTESRMIPLESISSAYYGENRPVPESIAILLVFAGVAWVLQQDPLGTSLAATVLAVGLLFAGAYHHFNRSVVLGFVETSGVVSRILFQPSQVDGEQIDEHAARQICKVVQRLLEARQRRLASPPPPQRMAA